MNKTLLLLCVLVSMFAGIICADAQTSDYTYAFKDGKVVFKELTSNVGQSAWNSENTILTITDKKGTTLFNAEADSLTTDYLRPVADVLDIQFGADGSVKDASPMQNTVSVFSPTSNGKVPVYFSPTYKSYVGQFWNTYGKADSVYCKVDYADNVDFLAALKAGHTLECLFRLNYPEGGMANVEVKPFSSHQAGGTGIMICTKARGLNGGNELTFLPNVSPNGATSSWKWGVSGITPDDGTYYHVVGVWDKDNKKALIYVNGELMNTVDAEGELHLNASSAYHWFGIGCDAANGVGEQGAHYDIVNARIYGRPLEQEDVSVLWNEMAGLTQQDPVVIPSYDIEPEPIDTTTITSNVLLDIEFAPDGTAYDASPLQNRVETINTGGVSTYYNNVYKRYVASFSNPWAGTPTGYYKVDYESNKAFKDALQDGHTLECLIKPNFTTLGNVECKPFASHQSGGTGFLVCYPGEGGTSANEFTFLPNVSPDGSSSWKWCTSGVTPENNTYYHLVGVWNKELGTAEIYVNGQLTNTINADGQLRLPSAGSNWFAIGCDAAPGAGTNAWSGDIAMARVYDDALDQAAVDSLWQIVKNYQDNQEPDLVTNYSYVSGLTVAPGSTFPIKGEGFEEGDLIKLISVKGDSTTYICTTTLTDEGIKLVATDDLTSGSYRLHVIRGERSQDIGICSFNVSSSFPKGAQVIAHRGWWTKDGGTAQNSRQALYNAIEGEFYGSETDAWITSDGVVVINHNSTINGISIQNSTYNQIRNEKLSNGETIPTLEDYLDIMDGAISDTKLIIEIKTHSQTARNAACVDAVVKAVKEHELQDRVEYIAYSLSNCRRLVMNDSTAMVQYLNGDKEPAELQSYGIMGLDYKKAELIANNRIENSHKLGMVTNAYTIDQAGEMAEVNNLNIDFITTNYPDAAQQIYEYYRDNQPEPVESEAYLKLKALAEQCQADTLNAEDYYPQTYEAYTTALDNAVEAVAQFNFTDEEYTTLYDALQSAREGLTTILAGDVNLDTFINAADVVSVYNYIIEGEACGINEATADVNGDNFVNAADVVAIYNIIIEGSGE